MSLAIIAYVGQLSYERNVAPHRSIKASRFQEAKKKQTEKPGLHCQNLDLSNAINSGYDGIQDG